MSEASARSDTTLSQSTTSHHAIHGGAHSRREMTWLAMGALGLGEVAMHLRRFRSRLDRAPDQPDRLCMVPKLMRDDAEVVQRVGIPRPQLEEISSRYRTTTWAAKETLG